MYCGDGINDLEALAAADVGMAVGAADASAAATFSDKHYSVAGQLPSMTLQMLVQVGVGVGLSYFSPCLLCSLHQKDLKMLSITRQGTTHLQNWSYPVSLACYKGRSNANLQYTQCFWFASAKHAVRLSHAHCAQQSGVYHVCSDLLLW